MCRVGEVASVLLWRKDIAGGLVPRGYSRFHASLVPTATPPPDTSATTSASTTTSTTASTTTSTTASNSTSASASPSACAFGSAASSAGGATQRAEAAAGAVTARVRDNGDGSFTASYTVYRAGGYALHITHATKVGLTLAPSP